MAMENRMQRIEAEMNQIEITEDEIRSLDEVTSQLSKKLKAAKART